ncbi:MAG: FAD:protein FMN transferase [Acidobacteria bacterium]|nr:FAD:protein FMN transferase [Acidobacteriota bacterium]
MTSSSRRAAYLAVSLVWTACAGQPRLFEAVEPHMGTLVRIRLYAEGEEQAAPAMHAAFARIAEVDRELSDYLPDSEVNRLCRAPAGTPVAVSADLFRVLEASQDLAAESGGEFDVTLGPVIRLWRQARRDGLMPAADALKEARARTGYAKMRLDAGARTVTLAQAGMQLDLGAIGKGYAADAALAVLCERGITRALVAASGDLAFGDPPPGHGGWRIGIDTRVLELRNAAVSTSGAAQQHADIGGKRYSHIIDPASGLGLTAPITVSVIAPRGIESDSLSTAVSVLGAERGLKLIAKRPHTAALIAGGGRVIASPGWPGEKR